MCVCVLNSLVCVCLVQMAAAPAPVGVVYTVEESVKTVVNTHLHDDKKVAQLVLQAFATQGIRTIQDLYLLTRDDLAEMNIPIGPRNRLLHGISTTKRGDTLFGVPFGASTR
jgi:hypothetical protein